MSADWFEEYEARANAERDIPRARLGAYHRRSYQFRETDPAAALALLAEGRRQAEALGEPWWMLFYDQQRVHALLHFAQDYRDVLELAVRNTLEVRKPAYDSFPRRELIFEDLVSAYIGIDAVSHDALIRQALDYLDALLPPDGDDRYLWLGSRRQLALEHEDFDEARHWTERSLALAADDDDPGRAMHFASFAYSGMCEVAFRTGDDRRLIESAYAGEETAREVGHMVEMAGFRLWIAYAERRRGDEAKAGRYFRDGVSRLRRLAMQPDSSYRDAEAAYHEIGGDDHRALASREAEWEAISGRGRLRYEANVAVKRLELRRRLGVLTPDDVEEARAVVGRLKVAGRAGERLAVTYRP